MAAGQPVAHIVTIENFQFNDAVFLSGYSAADNANFGAAVVSSAAQTGGFSVTLSDRTTIQFTGNHPTYSFNGGTVAV